MANWVRGIGQNLISNFIWWLLVGILSGLAVFLTYLTPSVRAFAPLSYLLVALVVLLLAAVLANYAVAAWRRYNPAAVGPVQAALDQSEIEQLREQLTQVAQFVDALLKSQDEMNDALTKGLKAVEEKQKVIIQDYQNVLGKLAQIEEGFAKHKAHISEVNAAQDKARLDAVGSLSSDITEIRRACAGLEETVKKNDQFLRQSLYAVFARERLKELSAAIERDANDLYLRLKSGEVYTAEEWDQWTNVEHHWERTVKEWVDTARWYAKDVKKVVLTVDDKEYDDPWSVRDNQFPSADAVRRFKRHRIIHAHWLNMKDAVEAGLLNVAFHGQTEEEQHGGKFHNP
jgi:hypothetical protein